MMLLVVWGVLVFLFSCVCFTIVFSIYFSIYFSVKKSFFKIILLGVFSLLAMGSLIVACGFFFLSVAHYFR
jgi:hypothetical protein